MMKSRHKRRPDLYPKWMNKQDSPSELCRQRDGLVCVDCGIAQYTQLTSASGAPYFVYLHASHLHQLDPDPVEPIENQRLRARCPRCHRIYDMYWQRRAEEVEHQVTLHEILRERQMPTSRYKVENLDEEYTAEYDSKSGKLTLYAPGERWEFTGEAARKLRDFLSSQAEPPAKAKTTKRKRA